MISGLVSINEVALHRARLLLGWVMRIWPTGQLSLKFFRGRWMAYRLVWLGL